VSAERNKNALAVLNYAAMAFIVIKGEKVNTDSQIPIVDRVLFCCLLVIYIINMYCYLTVL
jgi:hypothetical protein